MSRIVNPNDRATGGRTPSGTQRGLEVAQSNRAAQPTATRPPATAQLGLGARPHLLFPPGASRTFDQLLHLGISLGVKLQLRKPKAGDTGEYDVENNVIRINPALEAKAAKGDPTYEGARALAHELSHARDYRWLASVNTPEARRAAIQDAWAASSMDEVVKKRIDQEFEADVIEKICFEEAVTNKQLAAIGAARDAAEIRSDAEGHVVRADIEAAHAERFRAEYKAAVAAHKARQPKKAAP